jgi:hypothetical protein
VFPRAIVLLASLVMFSLLLTNSGKSASSSRGFLVVANQKEHTVLVIDPESRLHHLHACGENRGPRSAHLEAAALDQPDSRCR